MKITTGVSIGLGIAAAVGLYLAARKALPALNPANPDNVVNSAVSSWGGAVFDAPDDPGKNADGSWSLGGWLYDVLNADTAEAVKNMSGTVEQKKSVAEPETWVPADPNTSSTWGA